MEVAKASNAIAIVTVRLGSSAVGKMYAFALEQKLFVPGRG